MLLVLLERAGFFSLLVVHDSCVPATQKQFCNHSNAVSLTC